MKPKAVAIVVLAAVAAIVVAVQFRPALKIAEPARIVEAPKTTPAAESQPTPAPSTAAAAQAAPAPSPTPEWVRAPEYDAIGPGYDGMDEPYLTPSAVQALLEEYGLDLAYRIALPDHRRDIVDYLSDNDLLRSSLPTILGREKDSELRAYMLEAVIPIGLFDEPVDGAEPRKDMELVALLRQEPSTPQTEFEWIRRLNLARLVDTPSALEFARDSQRRFPDDPAIGIVAAEAILAASLSGDASDADGRRAQQTIADLLSAGDDEYLRSINSDYRLRAYMTIASAPDRESAMEFLRTQYEREKDPRLLKALKKILEPEQ